MIRPLQTNDFPAWLPLWDGNNLGQRNKELTAETWARLTDPDYPVFGLGAFEEERLVGILHYVLHPTTGNIAPVCYMQDLYVDPPYRRQGTARALVTELAKVGEKEKWARIYWLSERGNEAAGALYKDIGVKLDFTLHILPVGKI